ncbi:MAG: SDR family oxidoreductase [Desulfuromonadales bacterium]|nr:MAG: SDR family oxidoreductase [Desulfuromonadales bacterium]
MTVGQRVLVTGANGFIGTALCRVLRENSRFVRGGVRSLHFGGELVADDYVALPLSAADDSWSAILSGVDTVVHLAARVHVMADESSDPAAYRLANVAGTEHLAREAARAGVSRFIFLSSVKVNGEGRDTPYTEADEPAPLDPYGNSKWEAETTLRQVAAEAGLEVVIIRPPLVYGPRVKANFLRLLQIVRQGMPLPFTGINNRRSLIYLGNLVDAIITCVSHPKAAGQTYLVSDGDDVSTPELVRRTGEALGRPARLFPFPPALMRLAGRLFGKAAAVERLLGSLAVDDSKIRRELGWKPPFTMKEGLKETAEWFNHETNR